MFSSSKVIESEIELRVPIEKIGEYFESPLRLVRINPNLFMMLIDKYTNSRSMENINMIEEKRRGEWNVIEEMNVMGISKEIRSLQKFNYINPGRNLTLETIPSSSYGLNSIMNLSFESKSDGITLVHSHLTLKASKLVMPFAFSKAESSQLESMSYLKEMVELWYDNGKSSGLQSNWEEEEDDMFEFLDDGDSVKSDMSYKSEEKSPLKAFKFLDIRSSTTSAP